ncbi:hypothetical protein [Lacticaseibacillus paracasei]|nr:hypothetical protein [Lacticaseibacillus paracasei]MCI0373312.1 hypothetical protein [Lacticaseibacillus paracasei]
MGKYGVIVLDSFGVGAMDDVPKVRPDDIGANTALNTSIFKSSATMITNS